jgi:hypothetical protein
LISSGRPCAGLDLVEDAGRHFQPFLDLRAGDRHGAHRVGIEIEVGDILDRDVAGRHVGVIVRAAAAAGLEGSRRRKHRQILELGVLQHVLDVPGLRLADDLHRRVVGDQREIGIERRGRLADRRRT